MPVTNFAKLNITDVPISKKAVVPCPLDGTQVKRRAYKSCPSCENFAGIAKLMNGENSQEDKEIEEQVFMGKIPWSRAYAIRCVCVMEWVCEDFE